MLHQYICIMIQPKNLCAKNWEATTKDGNMFASFIIHPSVLKQMTADVQFSKWYRNLFFFVIRYSIITFLHEIFGFFSVLKWIFIYHKKAVAMANIIHSIRLYV